MKRSVWLPWCAILTILVMLTGFTACSSGESGRPAVGAEANPGLNHSAASMAGLTVFRLDQRQSQARFSIDEVLLGSPKTVVGTTSLVSGTIAVNPAELSSAVISPIIIDARDFQTDDDMRNRALRRFVLQTARDEYRYITFEPTAISGLPTAAKAGDQLSFAVTGNLTIRTIVQPVTFTVDLSADSATQFSGLAKASIQRKAFDLTIPNVPGVANVAEAVLLELDFVASAQ